MTRRVGSVLILVVGLAAGFFLVARVVPRQPATRAVESGLLYVDSVTATDVWFYERIAGEPWPGGDTTFSWVGSDSASVCVRRTVSLQTVLECMERFGWEVTGVSPRSDGPHLALYSLERRMGSDSIAPR